MSSQYRPAIRNGHGNGHDNSHSNAGVDPNGHVPVTPIPLNPDELPSRRNANLWFEEAEKRGDAALELSLFIRAMTTFQKLGPRDQLSYFRIAGIHGFPENVSWNMEMDPIARDDPHLADKIKAGEGGFYCMHNQYRFGTWHRVYMMLFERRVSDLMKEEVKAMNVQDEKDRAAWEAAAVRWRLPYWDWALDPRLPKLASMENITIVTRWNAATKQFELEDVPNPMYRFQMPGGRAMGDKFYGDYRVDRADGLPFDLCKGTSRHGISWYAEKSSWIDGVTDVDEVNAALEHPEWPSTTSAVQDHDTIKDAVQRLLNPDYNASWEQFISTKYEKQDDSAKDYISLEAIHNNLHNWIGGSDAMKAGGAGHMCSVPVAAFDPVFWLHHCNVDRLMYLWQAIKSNNEKWFNNAADGDDNAQAPLRPFRRPENSDEFYDSNKVRSLSGLNYTYDDIVIQTADAEHSIMDRLNEALSDDTRLAKRINGLYGELLPHIKDPQGAEGVDFIVNVVYNRFALGGLRYTLRFFLGDDRVGSIHTFSSPIRGPDGGAVRCAECAKQADAKVLSRAQVPILRAVRSRRPPKAGEDAGAYKERMDAYLKENLRWVAVLDSGAEIPKAALPDVEITVLAGKFEARGSNDEWVRFGHHALLEGATRKL
ncbi:Tyrosinase [Lasiodiplodia hormozganensis]|uniref:tyrosinase n=1 Tax=Lasiodiplodia hormozganensis TaxID=869390 RepID=A0AA39XY02_9PEZI|nr:Tyrosinase [Lasiodiplodia hormozganensis]